MSQKHTPGTIKSDKTLFGIIEQLNAHGQAGVTELAEETGVSKGAVHKHLKTLEEAGYVDSTDGRYQLSFKFLTFGGKVRGTNALCVAARNTIEELTAVTDEIGSFAVYEDGQCLFAYIQNDEYGLKSNVLIGERYDLNQCAEGKAILACLPDQRVEEQTFSHLTDETIVERERLWEEVSAIRENGYAISTGEMIDGLNAIAVPVSHEGTLGAICISGPAHRLTRNRLETEYAERLSSAVNEMELRLRFGQVK